MASFGAAIASATSGARRKIAASSLAQASDRGISGVCRLTGSGLYRDGSVVVQSRE